MDQSKTIGDMLKEKRESLGLTFETIEKELMIKQKYLKFLESNRFQAFESKVQTKGFLKNYARFLGLNQDMMVALYRRDFENIDMKREVHLKEEEEEIEPIVDTNFIKQQLDRIVIRKKHIVIASTLFFALIVGLIFINTIRRTFEKPELLITAPFEIASDYEGRIAYNGEEIRLSGEIEKGTSLIINSVPIAVNADYTFETEPISLPSEENIILIESENAVGAKSIINLTLYKEDLTIEDFNAFIYSDLYVDDLTIKSDGVVRFEGGFLPGEPLDIFAYETIEITTPNFENLLIKIDDREIKPTSERTVLRNTGKNIEVE